MKKDYITPSVETVEFDAEVLTDGDALVGSVGLCIEVETD